MLPLDGLEQLDEVLSPELLKRFRPLLDGRDALQWRGLDFARGGTKDPVPAHALALENDRDDRDENEERGGRQEDYAFTGQVSSRASVPERIA